MFLIPSGLAQRFTNDFAKDSVSTLSTTVLILTLLLENRGFQTKNPNKKMVLNLGEESFFVCRPRVFFPISCVLTMANKWGGYW